ncbi:MAG: alpha/beta hydrolase [Deltaproteobacteria bacterium]|nr:alpha/beta hydrolase [Deltaproteobacteria bacterium]
MTVEPSLAERVEGLVARGVLRLPVSVLRWIAGSQPISIDGQTLDLEVQVLLRLLAVAGGRPLDEMTPAEGRESIRSTTRALASEKLEVAQIEPMSVKGPAGEIGARLYRPDRGREPRPLVVYYHGGGWVVGDLDTHDDPCRFLAVYAGVNVLAVDYRLAPEHRFPAAVDDAVAAFRFAAEQAGDLGSAGQPIAVAGDSAGGNLSAVVAQRTVRDGGPAPAFQLLIYPVTDLSKKHESYRLFSEGFFLTEKTMDWYRDHYLPDPSAARDPAVSPLLAADLSGLPPAHVVTAGFDPLRDEGEAYARRLEAAGVKVSHRRYAGLVHGFANVTSLGKSAPRAMEEVATALREGLAAR